jgi:hypothetical protein
MGFGTRHGQTAVEAGEMKMQNKWVLLAALALTGCGTTSVQFDYKPRPVTLPANAAAGDNALVLGQAYLHGYAEWVQVIITSVDDVKTHSQAQIRPTINFLVPPGKHTFHVKALLSNSASWKESNDPQVSMELLAGEVYQMNAREATNIRGEGGIEVWLEHLGTIAQYQSFLKRNRDYRLGQPLTAMEITAP